MEPENDGSQEGISSSSCSLSGSMLACRCVYRLKTYLTTFDIYIIKWPENMLPIFDFWEVMELSDVFGWMTSVFFPSIFRLPKLDQKDHTKKIFGARPTCTPCRQQEEAGQANYNIISTRERFKMIESATHGRRLVAWYVDPFHRDSIWKKGCLPYQLNHEKKHLGYEIHEILVRYITGILMSWFMKIIPP